MQAPGHHLQVCPTNLDPAYDKPPDASYECEICGERGKHFKSLCPLNKDPYSIYQKRKAKGIKTPPSNRGKIFREWEKEFDEQRKANRRERRDQDGRLTQVSSNASLRSSSPTPSLRNERLEQLQKIEDMKARLFNEESYDIDEVMGTIRSEGGDGNARKRARLHDQSGSSSRGASPTPSMLQGLRKKVRMNGSDDVTSSPRMDFEMAETLVDKLRSSNLHENRGTDTEMVDVMASSTGSRIRDNDSDNIDPFYFIEFGLRPKKMNPDSMSIDESDTDSSDRMDIEIPKPPKEYSRFVQKLIQNHPEMSEMVNSLKRRPTAIDIWRQDDQRRLELSTAK
jgi:hypothetical protein